MFESCYLRLGQGVLASCAPLSVSLLASIYVLPSSSETSVRHVLDQSIDDMPWSASFAVAPEQTAAAVGAMLKQVMLATQDLEPASVEATGLPDGARVRRHLDALLRIWQLHPEVMPSDLRQLKHFLRCSAEDAIQPIELIWDRNNPSLSGLERTVLERIERHHGKVDDSDRDFQRLIVVPKASSASADTLLGHVQRHLLEPKAPTVPADDSFSILSMRDCLTECETTAAIVQHWLSNDATLQGSDIGIVIPYGTDYELYLAEILNRTGLVASSLTASAQRRNIGAEAVLLFVQCRRRPAPAMALASLYSNPVLCWSAETGALLATATMEGKFDPTVAETFSGKAADLYALIRSPSPSSAKHLREHLRQFSQLLSTDEALRTDVLEAKVQVARLMAALAGAPVKGEADWDQVIRFAAAYQELPAVRDAYYLGGLSIIRSSEAPTRSFRKLVVLGFNDGYYPPPPTGNPFFLDSEIGLIAEHAGLALTSQADQLNAALTLLSHQLCCASEQVVLLLSERDRAGDTLAPSSSLPLVARLVADIDDPEKFIAPLARSEATAWDRLITWRSRPNFKPAEVREVPTHFDLGFDLLNTRRNDDGSPKPQSPSRLETLLVSPLAWLLNELSATHLSWQPEQLDVTLRGSLAHEVFELLFPAGTNHPSDAEIEARVPEIFLERIKAIAPFLQSATWVVERNNLEAEIIKAAKHWSMVLKVLNAEIVGNEFLLAGSLFDHPVHGRADCLLRMPDGQPIVIDYKKSGTGNRRKRLKAHWDLQVDLYRKMDAFVDEDSKDNILRIADCLSRWDGQPAVAYHLLNDGGVLSNGADALDCSYIENIPGDIAENALKQLSERFEALRAGRLETNTPADEKYYSTKAALGTYAFKSSPLIAAFMRDAQTGAPDELAQADA